MKKKYRMKWRLERKNHYLILFIVVTLFLAFFPTITCYDQSTAFGERDSVEVISTFDSDLDGWTITGDGSSNWENDSGNPGGWMKVHDNAASQQIWAIAPSKFLGDWSEYSKISVDMKRIFPTNPDQTPDFTISGPGGSASHDSSISPDGTWKTIEVPLEESSWTIGSGTWGNILNNVQDFRFDCECDNSGVEEVGMDNIALYSASNLPPVAQYTYSPPVPNIGENIDFDASGSYDPDGSIEFYRWDWNNDGIYDENSTESTITHSYSTTGPHIISLQVIDDLDASNDFTDTVYINNPPTAQFTYAPSNPTTGQSMLFDASTSIDSDGIIIRYEWDWDSDGIYDVTQSTAQTTHQFQDHGYQNITLRVTDDHNATGLFLENIYINNPPVASFDWSPHSPDIDEQVTFDASESSDSDGNIVLYEWDWDHDGIYDTLSTDSMETHSWNQAGTHDIQLRVTDNLQGKGYLTKSINVAVVNDPPVITIDYPIDGQSLNQTINITGRAFDQNSNLSISSVEIRIDDQSWHLAKGKQSWYYMWNTTTIKNGNHVITARAYDGELYSDEQNISVMVNNENPVYTDLVIDEITGGFGVTAKILNKGTDSAYDIPWSIDVKVRIIGLILSGGHTEGISEEIPCTDEGITIGCSELKGIGPMTIEILVDQTEKTASGFLIGPLMLRVNE